jgi:superfamily II DNA or RNA helicase
MSDPIWGRDRRRGLGANDRRRLYARAGGLCESCGTELGADWHGAHLLAHVAGGATEVDEMQAECPKCNLKFGPGVMEQVEGFHPRVWQQVAFRKILLRLWGAGSATLHAAPGAGKTLFAAVLARHLMELGIIRRIVIFVPNTNLVGQTVKAYKRVGVFLDEKPRDSTIEHPQTSGLVVCYQSLSDSSVRAHVTRMELSGTLVIFDEVHHLAEAENSAWGAHVANMVGRVSDGPPVNAVAVLNMTGTLFRSAGNQRISTVRYRRVGEDTHEAIADHSVTTSELVGSELRAPDLYIYGGRATLVDLEEQEVIEAEIVDLSQRQRSAVAREMFRDEQWLAGYAAEGLRLLATQLAALRHEVPLKALHVADDQNAAAKAVAIYNRLGRERGLTYDIAEPVYTDSPGSARRLDGIRSDPRPRVIVTCQMVTEGFDCPDLCVLVHATRKAALLFVAQVMARVMRLTDYERAAQMMLPAQILIPDSPVLKDVYATAIAAAAQTVHEDAVERCHRNHSRARCPCLFPQSECLCAIFCPQEQLRRYDVIAVDDPRLDGATVLGHEDGHVPLPELTHFIAECRKLIIPEPFAPKIAVLVRRSGGGGVFATATGAQPSAAVPEPRPANPRDLSDTYRARLKKAAGFMKEHVGHDKSFRNVAEFQGRVNDAGGIPPGGRDLATLRQLSTAAAWACSCVRLHCEARGELVPEWAEGINRG